MSCSNEIRTLFVSNIMEITTPRLILV